MALKDKTLADFVAIAISPVLIMALVGSLVFFLLEVLYQGMHSGNLQWILFFFVFGAVLIARISMEAGIAGRAAGYGAILGLLVWLALLRYVQYPPGTWLESWGWAVNLGLIAIIWWSAHRLTWDCTLIDDEVDASGAGLLEVAGLEQASTPQKPAAPPAPPEPRSKKKKKQEAGLSGWWARYQSYRAEQKKKPQAPGVWVVYFSLAALPLFGLGQSQIPPEETERRARTFWLLCIYVGSGLGLLLTTSFLGLRRYLRQRKLQMPKAVTSAWLTVGVLLIVALMFVGAALPRPTDASPLYRWADLSGKEQKPSPWGMIGEGQEKKDDHKAGKKVGEDPDATKKGDKGVGAKDSEVKKDEGPGGKDAGGKAADKGQGKSGEKGSKSDKIGEKKQQEQSGENRAAAPPPTSNAWQKFFDFLAGLLKWLVLAAVAILAAFFVVRAALQFMANFTGWARRLLGWWNRWLAAWRNRGAAASDPAPEAPPPPRPFASFRDPFLVGVAERMTGPQLVSYSFEAMEAWARERGFGRADAETPMEFSHRIGDDAPAMENDARRLSHLYAGLAYARGNLGSDGREMLRTFWATLRDVAERPQSAGTERLAGAV